jgi:pimeloyl-ACP methyl ester carboxylesterase
VTTVGYQNQVTVGGVRSPVYQTGDAVAEEAVVFVHGNPGTGADWEILMSQTGEFARAVAPDMPGFGDADKPNDFDYTVPGYSRHLAGVLDQLGVRRVHLVLHDFGGPWGLHWAQANPQSVASLTLIDTGVLVDYKWHKFARIWRTRGVGELFQAAATRRGFKLLLARDNPRLSDAALDHLYELSREWPTKRAVLRLYRSTPVSAFTRLQPALRGLDLPTLVVWGADDAYLPWQQAERQRETFPSARVEVLDGLGHWPFVEDPVQVAELVVPFLREQTAG